MANRTGEPIDDYSSEYYQSSLQYIKGYDFCNKVFATVAALVTPNPDGSSTAVRYLGQPLSIGGSQRIVTNGWDHEHCYVCMWTIGPGDSYWQNSAGDILCDECHAFVSTDPHHGKR